MDYTNKSVWPFKYFKQPFVVSAVSISRGTISYIVMFIILFSTYDVVILRCKYAPLSTMRCMMIHI